MLFVDSLSRWASWGSELSTFISCIRNFVGGPVDKMGCTRDGKLVLRRHFPLSLPGNLLGLGGKVGLGLR